MTIQTHRDAPLADLTTLRVGGPAEEPRHRERARRVSSTPSPASGPWARTGT
ncbi:hypothetical protein [Clavibacter tessellarius]|uniref:hypothetical protein n=1 Tax=Clavibacter tessellarius TaxID=31965 RepID=UPI0032477F6D